MITVKTASNCDFYVALSITMLIAMKEKIVNKFAILNHFSILLLPFLLTIERGIYTQVLMSNRYTCSLCGSLQKKLLTQIAFIRTGVEYHNVPSIQCSKTGKQLLLPTWQILLPSLCKKLM